MINRILFGIDGLAVLVIGYAFVSGLAHGSIAAASLWIWAVLIAASMAILIGGAVLTARGHKWAARILLAVLALPALAVAGFVLLILIVNPPWT